MSATAFSRLAVVSTAIVVLALAPGAGAVDDSKPTPCGGTLLITDGPGDQANTQVPAQFQSPNTELTGAFLKYDAGKGETTYNIVVKKLEASVPAPYVSDSWNAYFDTSDGTRHFVRAFLDTTGTVAYEHGTFTENPTGVGITGLSLYAGTTTGKLFEGDAGIIQIVIPKEFAAPGAKLTHLYVSSGQGITLPASAPGYFRGLSAVMDNAPSSAPESAPATFTVAPCTAAAPAAGGGGGTPKAGAAKLPVKLASSSAKAPKGKSLVLGLKASKPVSKLAAKLLKGTKTVGSGKLASLSGSGKLKLKLSSKLKKGSYVLTLTGSLSDGSKAKTSLKLKLR
jgi:hypothetical protein